MTKPAHEQRGDEQIASVDQADVGGRARKGVKWSALQIVFRNVLSLGTTAVLARILSPGDFGLVGMVATLTALLQVFSDMGLSWATIQRQQLTRVQVSNLFWINTIVGLLFWGFCILIAPAVADFYKAQELVGITAALGAGFFLSGLAAQPIALLYRSMNYKASASIEMVANLSGSVVALLAASAGMGYWAIVIQSLVSSLVRVILVLPRSGITVTRPQAGVGTYGLVSFGGLLAINGLLIYFARNLDSVLIGKYWGATELGYYNRAYFLMLLPSMLATGVLSSLMVPALSALQTDMERFAAAYRKALCLIAFIACPLSLGLALTADEMVRLVYGPQWQPVVPMLMWLSIASVTQPLYNTTGWLFTAVGKPKAYLLLTVISGIVLSVAFYWGVMSGALGVAKVYGVVMGVLIFLPAMWLAHKVAGLSLLKSFASVAPVALCLMGMACAVLGVEYLVSGWGFAWQKVLLIKILLGGASYLALALMLMKNVVKSEVLGFFRRA